QVQALTGLERLQRDAFQEDVLPEHLAGETQVMELGLIDEEHLSSVPGTALGMAVADEPTVGLGDGALHGAHGLAARSGEAERPDHAGRHVVETWIEGRGVTAFE